MNKLNEIFDKIYVISYVGSPRLSTLKDRLKDLDYEIFYGVNKKDIDIQQMRNDGYKYALPPFNWSVDVYACGFSHTLLWKKLKNNQNKNILILEDDVIIIERKHQSCSRVLS